ncbi:MAG TPA: DUF433 domain-containing protein [Ktedonobacterales bacterium]|nr:DUF433 domain-containing protein [Ktedonobacterales bacterium]
MKVADTGHIIIEPDVMGGEAHIASLRIAVSDVAIWVNYHHLSPGEIAERFQLSLGDVYAALAYYHNHKDEIDQNIAETDRQAAEMAERFPHGWPDGGSNDVVDGFNLPGMSSDITIMDR